jgi:hypothetical protein
MREPITRLYVVKKDAYAHTTRDALKSRTILDRVTLALRTSPDAAEALLQDLKDGEWSILRRDRLTLGCVTTTFIQ